MRFIIILLLFLNANSFGQKPTSGSQSLYVVKVLSLDKAASTKEGALYALNDSSISLVSNIKPAKKGRVPGDQDIIHIPVKEIQYIKLRKSGSRRQGAILGGLLGGLIGGITGNIIYKPCTNPGGSWFGCMEIFDQRDHILFGAFLGLMAGSAVGYGISNPRKFVIFRDQQTYFYLKDSLEYYLYKPPALQPQTE